MRKKKDANLSQNKILLAARSEFVKYGFDGARVDRIATKAKVNKQLIYYYFKSKDLLFTEVLKLSYQQLRKEEEKINIDNMTAYEAMLNLIVVNWNYYQKNPDLIFLLSSENLMRARHVKEHLATFLEINKSWGNLTREIIAKGKEDRTIRDNLDPMQLNISIAALVIFYITNGPTLSLLYDTDLASTEEKEKRLQAIKETIGEYIAYRA